MNNLSIKYKLLFSFILVAMLILPATFYAISSATQLKRDLLEIVDHSLPRIEALLEMKSNAIQVNSLIENFDIQTHTSLQEISNKKDELLASLEEMDRWQRKYQRHLVGSESTFDFKEFNKRRDAVIFSALNAFTASEKRIGLYRLKAYKIELHNSQEKLGEFITQAILRESLSLENTKIQSTVLSDRVYRVTMLTNTIIISLAIIISLILTHFISSPIIRLSNFARSISPDNLEERAVISTNDEIGQLGASLNSMLDHLSKAKTQLINISRQAGKAEVATSILHNVGNILNSVSISVAMMKEQNLKNDSEKLSKLITLIQRNLDDIKHYLVNDPKGKIVLPYLTEISMHFIADQNNRAEELNRMIKNLGDIKEIINLQQSHARVNEITEKIVISDLIEEALTLYSNKIIQEGIVVEKNYSLRLSLLSVKAKLQQILYNIIKNAIEALSMSGGKDRRLRIGIEMKDDKLKIIISDNGVGIKEENLEKIFSFGFTTKVNGHGYGLHNCALLAHELGGELRVESSTEGKNTSFILELKNNKFTTADLKLTSIQDEKKILI